MPSAVISTALRDLKENGGKRFKGAQLSHAKLSGYATPRRLILHTPQLAARQADRTETLIGPPAKVAFDAQGNPTPAATGFAKNIGVALSQLTVSKTEKGEYLSVERKIASQPAPALLQEIVPDLIASLHFPKEMRWKRAASFVRPIRWIVASYNGKRIPCAFAGVSSGDVSYGHRLIAPKPFRVTTFSAFRKDLRKRSVLIDPMERYTKIKTQIHAVAKKSGGAIDEDEALFWQAAFTTEYPVVLRGTFDPAFLTLPKEIISTAMKEHQGYFPLHNPKTSELLPHFIAVSNNKDRQGRIRRGYERVLRARLSDAQFFFAEDRKVALEDRLAALKGISFHEGLGTLYDKTERLIALSKWIAAGLNPRAPVGFDQRAPVSVEGEAPSALLMEGALLSPVGFNQRANASVEGEAPWALPTEGATRAPVIEEVEQAARCCKCDLTTGIVREFPSLQGVMGRILSSNPNIGKGIQEHYQPRYAGDLLPQTPVGQILAIADKLDTIAGCFGIGAIPSGSEDPYALRRLGAGIIQILSENDLFVSFSLREAIVCAVQGYDKISGITLPSPLASIVEAACAFFNQRLDTYLQSYKIRYDIIAAVLGRETALSSYHTLRLAQALRDFSTEPLFNPLLTCYKRATRILPSQAPGEIDPSLLTKRADSALYEAVTAAGEKVTTYCNHQEFGRALEALATLYNPLDRFFTEVLVMDPDKTIQRNNLALLHIVKSLFSRLGDFSKIQEGYQPEGYEPEGYESEGKNPKEGASHE